ncbi:hypothetical protein GSI_14678 [Ganoderma sinense ZZ0214-1]|uniref:Uncharacterized protein n=1 Tax=Ganoderma sinense ZZ0214-1 TaxID=1077348 RepID=A0A2G8RPE0_9APHY|nr:hypothetical protein GSI_14678 [Ganoderma sinense ZZ0214-1]
MPRLQSLEFFHIDFVNGGLPPAAYMAFSRFSSVETLAFTNCFFPNFTTFRRLLVGLPSLRELALSNVHWHPVLPHHSSHLVAALRRPLLDSLLIAEVDRDCAHVFFEWLDCTTSSQTIRRLSLEASLASTSLKTFRTTSLSPMEVHIWLYDDAGLRELLPKFTQLRSLRITAPDMSEQSMWIQLSEMLEVISSPAIRSIAVRGFVNRVLEAELVSGDVRELLGVPQRGLELLEEALKRSVFEHLTALEVKLEQWIALPLDVQTAQNVVLEVIRNRLPKVFECGIATFDLQFTRVVFCGLPQKKEEYDEGTGMQGWMVIDIQRSDH